MLRSARAFMLATTALVTPAPVAAEPVTAFIAGLQAASLSASALTFSVSGAGIGFGAFNAGLAVGGFAATAVGRVVIGLGVQAVVNALTPSAPSVEAPRPGFDVPSVAPSAMMANFAQPVSYMETVYGQVRKGGPLAFTAAKGDRRVYVPILAAHEIEGVVEHWLEEWTVDVNPAVTDFSLGNLLSSAEVPSLTAPAVLGGSSPPGRIDVFTGWTGQPALAGLVDLFDEVTWSFDFAGLAGAVIWARRPDPEQRSETYPRYREWTWAPVIKGRRLWDPRTETVAWSANAALVIADWLWRQGQAVDWDEVAAEANTCDELVWTRDGVQVPRWELHAVLSDEETFEAQRARLAMGCDAFFYERPDGALGFRVGRYDPPTVTLTDADVAACTVTSGAWASGRPTEVAAVYVEPENAWRESAAGVWVEDAASRRVREEPRFTMVNRHNQALRLAKRHARARRPAWKLQGTLSAAGYNLIGQRFFRLELAALGIYETFEVVTLTRVGPLAWEIEAASTSPEDWTFDAATEEPPPPPREKVTSGGFETQAITGVAAWANDGGTLTVSWDPQPSYLWQQVQVRRVGDVDWRSETVNTGATSYTISGLADGGTYEVQARNGNAGLFSQPSAWAPEPALQVTTRSNMTAPAAVTSFAVEVTEFSALLTWVTPNDPNFSGTRLWRSSVNDFNQANLLTTIYSAPAAAASYADMGPLAWGTHYWWAATVNASGVEGAPQMVSGIVTE
jgi:hypothetical protein